jgi:hypothetical protein
MDHNESPGQHNPFKMPPRPTPPEDTSDLVPRLTPIPTPEQHHFNTQNIYPTPPDHTSPPETIPSRVDSAYESNIASPATAGMNPQPVVRVLSPRGVEYVFMAIVLITGAIALAIALLAMVNGSFSFSVLQFPLALLLVSVPVFSWLFLRLKRAELLDPAARLDASKRRSTQFLQIVSFLICFFTLIGFLVTVFMKISGTYSGSIIKVILDVLVILLVAGGILFYYWTDEHKAN